MYPRYKYLRNNASKICSKWGKSGRIHCHEISSFTPLRHLAKADRHLGTDQQGSVAFQAPGSWRWTFKIKGKTACVALSEEQATQMSQAIDNHKRLEELIREMREITQTLILETVPGVRRRKPISEIPKAR